MEKMKPCIVTGMLIVATVLGNVPAAADYVITTERNYSRAANGVPTLGYTTVNRDTVLGCRLLCTVHGSSQCRSYTWNEKTHACYLYSNPSRPLPSRGFTSGIAVNVTYGLTGKDYPGADADMAFIRSHPQMTPFATWNPVECQDRCNAQSGVCAAWTWVASGIQPQYGPSGRCWLKNWVPRLVDDPNTVAGQGTPE